MTTFCFGLKLRPEHGRNGGIGKLQEKLAVGFKVRNTIAERDDSAYVFLPL
jgi:hypothetical protein